MGLAFSPVERCAPLPVRAEDPLQVDDANQMGRICAMYDGQVRIILDEIERDFEGLIRIDGRHRFREAEAESILWRREVLRGSIRPPLQAAVAIG